VFLRYIALFALLCALARAQQPVSTPGEQVPTFQSKVDLVLLPVVVRDKRGEPIGNLTKDDFQLFDKGRRQGPRKLLGDPGARKKFRLSMGERPLCRLIRKPAHPAAAK
jgi:hypothetical protein